MKKKITYRHELKEGVNLEVVGEVEKVEDGRTYVRRIDDYVIDFPTANIVEEVELD